jgi:hypothetical protein
VAYPARDAEAGAAPESRAERQRARARGQRSRAEDLADTDTERQSGRAGELGSPGRGELEDGRGAGGELPDAEGPGREARSSDPMGEDQPAEGSSRPGWWSAEPTVGRVADGVPHRVDRLAALGNALVPQIAEWIGRRILEYERAARRGPVS